VVQAPPAAPSQATLDSQGTLDAIATDITLSTGTVFDETGASKL